MSRSNLLDILLKLHMVNFSQFQSLMESDIVIAVDHDKEFTVHMSDGNRNGSSTCMFIINVSHIWPD